MLPSKHPKRVRLVLFVACITTIAFSCTVIWSGFIISSSVLIQSLNYSSIGTITTICGFYLLAISTTGLYSLYKQDHRLYLVFAVNSILLGLILLIMGGYALYIRKLSGEVLMSESHCQKNFKNAENLTSKGGKIMCGLYCPCEFTSNLLKSGENLYEGSAKRVTECNPCENIQIYDEDTQNDIVEWVRDTLDFNVTAAACAVTGKEFMDNFYDSEDAKYAEFMAWMESQLGCSGMCTEQNKFLFSNVEDGTPNGACYKKLKVWASESFQAFGIMGVVFSAFQWSLAGLAFYLFRNRKKITPELPTHIDEIKETKINSVRTKF